MKNLIFVDDDSNVLESINRLIKRKKHDWKAFFATNVDSALNLINNNKIDTVVCDIKLPIKDGFFLLRKMQNEKSTRSIPVILMTGQLGEGVKLSAYKNGATDFLNKPFDEEELFVRISSALRLKSYHDEIEQYNLTLEDKIREKSHQVMLASEISSTLVRTKDLRGLLQSCSELIVKYLDAAFARVWVYDDTKVGLELHASAGMYTHINGDHRFIPLGHLKIGTIAQSREPHLTNNVVGDPLVNDQEWAKREGMVAFAGYPLVIDDRLVGVMGMFSRKTLKDDVITTLASVADKIALGIERKKAEEKVHKLSFYDRLTMLPNRDFFNEFIKKSISYASRYQIKIAIIFLDIDNFSRINESLGHNLGDECLKIVSYRLKKSLRRSDPVFNASTAGSLAVRMGGDIFALLLHDVDDINKINQVLKRIANNVSKVCKLESREVYLSVSMGVSLFPYDGETAEILLKKAEAALNYTKKKKGHFFGYYSESMNVASLEYLDIESDLHKSINSKDLNIYYQAKVEASTEKIVGFEALVRWHREDGSVVSPGKFIPLAESTGLIIPIGNFVIDGACHQVKEWQNTGLNSLSVAVNVSGVQFGQDDFVENILTTIEKYGIPPQCLEIEVTETAVMVNPERAIKYLHELKQSGIRISLDDFGTGYSSLSYLQKLPLDFLKIDMSFIKNIVTNQNDSMIVKAIVSMAHHLQLKVVAEGVEDENQLAFLRGIDCDLIQGYYYSPAIPSQNIPNLMNRMLKK